MDEDHIDRYLKNQLSEKERSLVEKEINQNPEFAQEFDLHKTALKALELGNERQLRAKMQTWKKEINQPTQSKSKLLPYGLAASLAAFILLLIIFMPVQKQAEQLFKENFTPLSLSNSKGTTKEQDYQEEIQMMYQHKNYAGILNYHKDLSPNEEKDTYKIDFVSLYYGVSALHTNDTPKAIHALKRISSSANPELYAQSQWYLGLAYLKNKQTQDAKKIFEQIKSDPRHLYYQKAKKILNHLS